MVLYLQPVTMAVVPALALNNVITQAAVQIALKLNVLLHAPH